MSPPPAVILAAGESSRFWPLSTHGHKSLHRLCGKAIIEHTVGSLVAAGVTELVIVQSPIARAAHFPHRTIEDQLGDGSRYGATIRYVEMESPTGSGDALLLCQEHLDGNFLMVNPENINAGDIVRQLMAVAGDVIAVQRQTETRLFGVCAVKGDRVVDIVEKPEPGTEPSQLCNMWVAKLGQSYLDVLRSLPSDPISGVTALAKRAADGELGYVESRYPFFPLKYPWHLFAMAAQLKPAGQPFIGEHVTIHPDATVNEDCVIETDSVIGAGVVLKSSLVGAGSTINAPTLVSAVLGADVTLAERVVLEDADPDDPDQTVHVTVKDQPVETGRKSFSVTVGHGTTLAPGVRVKPGILIGSEVRIGESVSVEHNIPDQQQIEAMRGK